LVLFLITCTVIT